MTANAQGEEDSPEGHDRDYAARAPGARTERAGPGPPAPRPRGARVRHEDHEERGRYVRTAPQPSVLMPCEKNVLTLIVAGIGNTAAARHLRRICGGTNKSTGASS